jgi:hypothetical protein
MMSPNNIANVRFVIKYLLIKEYQRIKSAYQLHFLYHTMHFKGKQESRPGITPHFPGGSRDSQGFGHEILERVGIYPSRYKDAVIVPAFYAQKRFWRCRLFKKCLAMFKRDHLV